MAISVIIGPAVLSVIILSIALILYRKKIRPCVLRISSKIHASSNKDEHNDERAEEGNSKVAGCPKFRVDQSPDIRRVEEKVDNTKLQVAAVDQIVESVNHSYPTSPPDSPTITVDMSPDINRIEEKVDDMLKRMDRIGISLKQEKALLEEKLEVKNVEVKELQNQVKEVQKRNEKQEVANVDLEKQCKAEIKKELDRQNNVTEDFPNILICQSYSLSETVNTLGQLVWAKMVGYPSWPAIVVMDPKTNQYFKVNKIPKKVKGSKKECGHLHVLFLNYQEEVAWIPKNDISLYKLHPLPKNRPKTDARNKAIHIANSLVHMSCDERLQKYTELQGSSQPQPSAIELCSSQNINRMMFPKLFMEPVVIIQRLESAMIQSLM